MKKSTIAILLVAGVGIVGISMAGFQIYIPVAEVKTDERVNQTQLSDTEEMSYDEVQEPEETEESKETETVTLEEYIADCKPLDVTAVQRNPDDYAGDFFYVDATLQTVTNKLIYAVPIVWDDEYKSYDYEESFMTLEIEDNRSPDIEGGVDYFNFVPSDNVRLYGRFLGRYDYESGMITYGFRVDYAELLEDE